MSQFVFLSRGGMTGTESPAEMQQQMQRWMSWLKDLGEKGFVKDPGQPLERGGKVVSGKQKLVTDGPFAETREQLGGYYLIDANDLDEAIGIAERIPGAAFGTIEIRPVLEISGLPGQF